MKSEHSFKFDALRTADLIVDAVYEGGTKGNRTDRGAHTQQILASVLRTIQQRELDASDILSKLLRSPRPISALASPTSLQ